MTGLGMTGLGLNWCQLHSMPSLHDLQGKLLTHLLLLFLCLPACLPQVAKWGTHSLAAAAKKLVEAAVLDRRNEWFVLVGDTTGEHPPNSYCCWGCLDQQQLQRCAAGRPRGLGDGWGQEATPLSTRSCRW